MSIRRLFLGLFLSMCAISAHSQVVNKVFNLNSSHRELQDGTIDPDLCPNPPDECHCKPNAGWVPATGVDPGYTGPFKEGSYVGRNSSGWPQEFMNWRMLYPTGYDPNRAQPYPMIVMLHGAGEGGRKSNCCGFDYSPTNVYYDNNGRNITIGGTAHMNAINRNPTATNSYQGIVIWPQSSYNGAWDSGWEDGNISANNRMVSEIIQYMIRERNVDPDRIAMHGLSNGAQGVWDLATKRTDLFATITPMSGVGSNQAEMVATLVTTPIWIFQGDIDTNPRPAASEDWTNAFNAAGGSMIRTVYANTGHGTWDKAYAEPNFFPFIKSKTKRDIYVFGGIAKVCAGSENGLKLGFSANYVEYIWTKDGDEIEGSNDRYYFAMTPGTYTVKYRRQPEAFNPDRTDQYGEWGESNPLVVGDAGAATYVPPLTNTGSVNLTIDGSGIDNRINFIAPVGNLQYTWYKNGVQIAQSTTSNTLEISSNLGSANDAGSYTVRVLQPSGCGSLDSNPIVVRYFPSQPNSPRPAAPQTVLVNQNQGKITWTDYGNETGYEVWRIRFGLGPSGVSGTAACAPPGKYTLQNYQLVKVLPANTLTYTDPGLRFGQAWYRYLVRAILPDGHAIFYNDPNLQVVTAADVVPPSVPANLAAGSVTSTGAVLTWTPSVDNDLVYAYEVYKGDAKVATLIGGTQVTCNMQQVISSFEATIPPPTTYTITGLEGNESYSYSVRALDWMGNYSPFSTPVTVTTQLFAGTTSGTGVEYRYYANTGNAPNLSTFDYNQEPTYISTNTNFALSGPPGFSSSNPGTNNYIFAWEGYLDVRSNEGTGVYTFSTRSSTAGSAAASNEPSQLYIDDGSGYRLVVNNPGTSSSTVSGTITLPAVGKYPIRVIYAEGTGNQNLSVSWTTPVSGSSTGIPNARLYRLNRTFYYLRTGSAGNDPTVASAWTTTSNGTGSASISNFSGTNAYYVLANRANVDINNAWTISASGSRIVVGNGSSSAVTVNLNNNAINGRLEANRNAVVAVNVDVPTVQFGTLHQTSSVNFNVAAATNIPVGVYGNVNLTQAQAYTLPMNVLEVQGNLDVVDGATTTGATNNFSTLKIGGDITFHNTAGSPLPASAATAYALTFTGAKNHTVSFAAEVDPTFFSISTDVGDVVTFNNANTHTYTIGTSQGGGLSNRGTINIGANNLVVGGRATINTNGETGDIAVNGGNFTLNSLATIGSNIYFNNTDHTLNNLNVTVPSATSASIQSAVDVTNLVSLSGGSLTSGGDGYLRLLSSLNGTARIAPLTGTSRINGPITAQRYMEAEGTIYRYISMPVKGVKVADLQVFFPITGTFTGADVIAGNGSSMFDYTETTGGYHQFPPTGGTNQDTLRTGRGYSAYIRDAVNATTIQVKGIPNQGTNTYTLTGGTTLTTGYNLVGNPYPAPVKWTGNSTGGWTMSGVNSMISIRENHADGSYQYKTWNGTTGNNTGGFIAVGQAYWVQTTNTSPSLVVTEAAKQITDGAFFREGDPENVISVKMKKGSQEDDTYIQFAREATPAFDKDLDGAKLNNSYFSLSTLTSDNKSVAINLTTTGQCDQTIKFRTSNAAVGSYQLVFSGITSLLADDQVIFTDAFTNTQATITDDYTYNFSVTADAASKADGRFKLKFVKPGVGLDNTLSAEAACNNSNPLVLVNQSQPGVDYTAFVDGVAVSEPFVGNGGNLSVAIDHTKIPYGKTHVTLKAGFMGCAQNELTNTINVNRDTVDTPAIVMNEGVLSVSNLNNVTSYQWFRGDEMLEDITTSEYTPVDSGAYHVEITKASCVLTSNEIVKKNLHLDMALTTNEVCNDDAVVTIDETQEGAKYRAYFGSIEASSVVIGTGGPIGITLDAGVITTGSKDIRVQAGFENDLPQFLTSKVTVHRDVLATPQVIVDGTKLKANVTGTGYKWYFNDELIADADQNEIDFTNEGTYAVEVTSGTCNAKSQDLPLTFDIRTDLTSESLPVCDNGATVTIDDSQAGVTYGAYLEGDLVSNEAIGNGGNVDLVVSTSVGFGQKQLVIKAGYLNNVKHDLQNGVTINRSDLAVPQVTIVGGILKADATGVSYAWYMDGQKIEGEISSAFEPSESGNYYVEVSNGICTRQSAPVNYAVTGVGEFDDTFVTVAPNPVRTRVMVVTGKSIQLSTVRLTSTLGQSFNVPISVVTDRSVELDVSELSIGFYLVHVNGQVVRLVKE